MLYFILKNYKYHLLKGKCTISYETNIQCFVTFYNFQINSYKHDFY